jgi:hypothetical protein
LKKEDQEKYKLYKEKDEYIKLLEEKVKIKEKESK